jgi:hypothetical protein
MHSYKKMQVLTTGQTNLIDPFKLAKENHLIYSFTFSQQIFTKCRLGQTLSLVLDVQQGTTSESPQFPEASVSDGRSRK